METSQSAIDSGQVTHQKRLRVGVLMGGRSTEREVSFNSGRTVCDHLDTFKYEIIPLFQRVDGALFVLPYRFLHRGKISDFEKRLDAEAEKIAWDSLKERIDFVYIAMHGQFAEDGTLQGFLEVLKIPYLGSKVLASALGMDKVIQKEIMKSNGISVPKGFSVQPHELEGAANDPSFLANKIAESGLTPPFIIKPSREGSSIGMYRIDRAKDLYPAIAQAAHVNLHKPQAVLVEECLQGMEFTCVTLTDYKNNCWMPLPPTEIVPEPSSPFFDYEQKYMPGRATKFTPARTSAENIKRIQDTCIKINNILNIENISRIDGFLTNDGDVVIVDPNTFSGLTPSSFLVKQAAEARMSHTTLINHLIKTELEHYGMLPAVEEDVDQERNRMITQQKKRVAVLLGGRTHEKEVSFDTGRNVFYKLSPHKYEPIALFVDKNLELYRINQDLLVCNSTKEVQNGLTPDMKVLWNDLPSIADFVFIGLHGGEGENGSIQGTLEMLGLPYNGSSVLTSALCIDKYKANTFLKSQGFDVPEQYLVNAEQWKKDKKAEIEAIKTTSSFPLIVKPHDDGCSVLVYKVKNEHELENAIEAIFADGKRHALVEEFLVGMELTVGVVGNNKARALPPSQSITTKDVLSMEEKFLPGAGENQTPALLPPCAITFVQQTIERAFEALQGKGYSRIDCFYQTAQQSKTGQERLVILEINTLPALTPATCIFHQAAEIGLKPMEFIDLIVELGFEEHMSIRTGSSLSHDNAEQIDSL